jgi:hypothetical protein
VIELLKYTLPAVLVCITTWLTIRSFFNAHYHQQELKLKENSRSISLPLRLQAYERLALLMERIDLFNLISQLRTPTMTVSELQLMMLNQIRSEFDHNVSLQIYVGAELWAMVRSTKEEMIMTVNRLGMSLPPTAPAKEFSRLVFEHLNELDGTLPTHTVLEKIKAEAKLIF